MLNNISYSYQRLTQMLYLISRAAHLSYRISMKYAASTGNFICNLVSLRGDHVQKTIKTARDTLKFWGIASSFRIKMSEMDLSVRSVAEGFCLYIVHKVTNEKLCTGYCH